MKVVAVLGGQWGDEGKGKVVDLLANRFDIVARYHGGHNAGHTVKFGDRHFALHLLPAGIVRGRRPSSAPASSSTSRRSSPRSTRCAEAGVEVGENLLLSDRAHGHPPVAPAPGRRARRGRRRGEDRHDAARDRPRLRVARRPPGDPRRGALPPRDAGRARRGHRRGDGRAPARPRGIGRSVGGGRRSRSSRRAAERIRPHVTDTGRYLRDQLKAGATLLAEGAHGAMLDLSAGTYPFVTSSHCTAGAVAAGLQIAPRALDASLLVSRRTRRAWARDPSRPSCTTTTGEYLRERGNEYGTSTGRPRRTGWFDAVVARTAVELSGADAVAITKLDCLDELEEIPVCLGYRLDGSRSRTCPRSPRTSRASSPSTRSFPAGRPRRPASRATRSSPPPPSATSASLEDAVGAPAVLISTGPRREETIWRSDMPFLTALPPAR